MSIADDILSIADIPSETVTVPEWGGMTLVVRGMDGAEASAFSANLVKIDEKSGKVKAVDLANFMPQLLVKTLYTEQGERVFREDQVAALNKKSGAVLKRLSDIAARLSGLQQDAVDDAVKNSAGTPPAALP